MFACRKQVDERPADGIFAMLGDRLHPFVTQRIELLHELIAIDPCAFLDPLGQLTHAEW